MKTVTKQVRLCPRGFILSDTSPFTSHLARHLDPNARVTSAPRAVVPGGRIEVHYQAPAGAAITLEASSNGQDWAPVERYPESNGCIQKEVVHEASQADRFVRWVVRLTQWSGLTEISSRDIA
jgi:hypothetical protein